ncbi:hypothetical protein M231_05181 [Tremella mesenterica]|uniref:Uncharacterized protein n=1 Tax=Tremella mesenterica TaxID=5217 RepID=A0A4Q1BIU1_TREME|nr:hypothetical protein M231_05181 [Tremella mesenterica]
MSEPTDTFDFTEIYEARGLTSSNAKSRLTTQLPETSSYSPSHLNNHEADDGVDNDKKESNHEDDVDDNSHSGNDNPPSSDDNKHVNHDDDQQCSDIYNDNTTAQYDPSSSRSNQDKSPEVEHEEMEDFRYPDELERALHYSSSPISETFFPKEENNDDEPLVWGVYRRFSNNDHSYRHDSDDVCGSPPLDNLIHRHLDSLRERFGDYFGYRRWPRDTDYMESRQGFMITRRWSGDSCITEKSAEFVYLSSEENNSEGEEEKEMGYESF